MSEKQPESTAPEQALVLEPPKPVAPVTTDQAATSIEVPAETAQQISASVQHFVDELSALDIHSSDFQQKVDSIHQLGNQEIKRSSEVSNRFLERPAASLENGIGAGSGVSHSLVALRRQVEDLDPSRQDGFERKILGIIPFGDGIRDYFHKYQSAQHNLDAILQSLYRGQDELQRDTVAIEQEKVNVWALKGRLEQYAYMAGKLDEALTAKIAQVQLNDPEKARSLQGGRALLRPPEKAGPADPARRQPAGLPGPGPGPQERPGADQGRRQGDHDHRVGAAHRDHRVRGAHQPEAGAGPGDRGQHDHQQPDRVHLRAAP
jgi:hypothetical protein